MHCWRIDPRALGRPSAPWRARYWSCSRRWRTPESRSAGGAACPFHGWTFTKSGKFLKVKNPEGAGYAWREEDQLPQQPGLPRLRDLPAMHGQSIPLRVPSRERCCIGLPGCATIGNRGLDHHYLSSQTFLVEGSSERIPNQISKIIVQKMASTLDDEGTRQRGDDLFIVGILTLTGNTGRDPVAPDVLDCRENTRLVVDQDVVARRITLLEDNPAAAEVLLTASMAAARRLQARPKLGRIRLELAPERYRLLVATRLSLSTGLRRRG